ncbi:MAG: SDR family NAD(P)-dependent oxidoreductase [Candidatus Velamenicoccus archaeovorus]
MQLGGAVVVVTGSSSGFGRFAGELFARRGAKVVLAARRVDRLEAVAARIHAQGGTAIAVRTDVGDVEQLQALRDRVDAELGRCDVLVNNAGVPGGGVFEHLAIEQIEEIVRTNLMGVLLGTKVFLPMMLAQGRGHVVNVASLAGRFAMPGAAVYSASKHAVVAFSEALYHELKPRGILVTTVNPAFAATEGFPQRHLPRLLVMDARTVARAIVRVVETGTAPEVNVPRGLGVFQAFRVFTPPLYRWGVDLVTRRYRATRAR